MVQCRENLLYGWYLIFTIYVLTTLLSLGFGGEASGRQICLLLLNLELFWLFVGCLGYNMQLQFVQGTSKYWFKTLNSIQFGDIAYYIPKRTLSFSLFVPYIELNHVLTSFSMLFNRNCRPFLMPSNCITLQQFEN